MTTLINKRDNFALSVSAILQFLWKVCKNLKLDPVISSISTSAESKKSVKLWYGCSKAGYQQEFRKKIRTEQDLNLRGQSPLDFESNALTTRPSAPLTPREINITKHKTFNLRGMLIALGATVPVYSSSHNSLTSINWTSPIQSEYNI